MRLKKMPIAQFEQVMERNWAPIQLTGDAKPDWLRAIPDPVLHRVLASGTKMPGFSYSSVLVPSGELIGGIDVYRDAPDDPVMLNKDWYGRREIPRNGWHATRRWTAEGHRALAQRDSETWFGVRRLLRSRRRSWVEHEARSSGHAGSDFELASEPLSQTWKDR